MLLGGTVTDLLDQQAAIEVILDQASTSDGPALGVVSVNLDHIHHFGHRGTWRGTIDGPTLLDPDIATTDLAWLALLDGAPLVDRASILTGRRWPRLAGSDLLDPLLDGASERQLRVGFLGGMPDVQEQLKERLAAERPRLRVAGWWAPERGDLTDPSASRRIAAEVRERGVDLLVVGLGKPRQELWISEYGPATGARALLAFGAGVDFLAGHIRRAPAIASQHGLEWAWRLALEPRRLFKRYLLQGPPAYFELRRSDLLTRPPEVVPSRASTAAPLNPAGSTVASDVQSLAVVKDAASTEAAWPPEKESAATAACARKDAVSPAEVHPRGGAFASPGRMVDVAALVVTHNSRADVGPLLTSLRSQDARIRLVVVDNGSTDGTLDELAQHTDVVVVPTGQNLGYAGGINRATSLAGPAATHLVLNPDLVLGDGTVSAMLRRLRRYGVGAVVPRFVEDNGSTYQSLRREPTPTRMLGDALFGARLAGRPAWLSEMVYEPEAYRHPHPVDWATGAAILVDAEVARHVGPWNESFFLYSEETDFCRRVRAAGSSIWYEPRAEVSHRIGGSGQSPQLTALMEVNRLRYARLHHGRSGAAAAMPALLLASLLRVSDPGHREAVLAIISRSRRRTLPGRSVGRLALRA